MLIVFAVVGILGWGMNKLGNAPEAKKQRFLKYYFIAYGILLITMAIYNFISQKVQISSSFYRVSWEL